MNEETVIAVGTFIILAYIVKVSDWLSVWLGLDVGACKGDVRLTDVMRCVDDQDAVCRVGREPDPGAHRSCFACFVLRFLACEQRIRSVLEASRVEHTQAVKDRIDSVGQLRDVVEITKGLFALSKVRRFLQLIPQTDIPRGCQTPSNPSLALHRKRPSSKQNPLHSANKSRLPRI